VHKEIVEVQEVKAIDPLYTKAQAKDPKTSVEVISTYTQFFFFQSYNMKNNQPLFLINLKLFVDYVN